MTDEQRVETEAPSLPGELNFVPGLASSLNLDPESIKGFILAVEWETPDGELILTSAWAPLPPYRLDGYKDELLSILEKMRG